jgi:hypothetical protein
MTLERRRNLNDSELEHFIAFSRLHPALSDKLVLWVAFPSTVQADDPAAAELFEKEFPELKS